jgi:hypothetical protein
MTVPSPASHQLDAPRGNRMSRLWLVCTLIAVGNSFTAGESLAQTEFLSAAQQTQLDQDLSSGNLIQAQNLIVGVCDRPLKESRDSERTLDARLVSAREAKLCFRANQSVVAAQTTDPNADRIIQPYLELAESSEQEARTANEFMGLSWGIGFGYSFGEDEAIDDAEIVDGVVRVKSRKKDQPRAVLEFHRYFWCNDGRKQLDRGCGLFVAVAASDEDVLAGVGIGFMYGRKSSPDDTEGFSVGVGVILDGNVKDLADGFKENAPPPGTETAVRFEEKSRWSALIIVTRTF